MKPQIYNIKRKQVNTNYRKKRVLEPDITIITHDENSTTHYWKVKKEKRIKYVNQRENSH